MTRHGSHQSDARVRGRALQARVEAASPPPCRWTGNVSDPVEAAHAVMECFRVLAKTGDNIVGEILRGTGTFTEWEHYPTNDAYDPESHAQYYYHAHPPEDRPIEEHGHFHLFMRPKGMPAGTRPASVPDFTPLPGDNDALSHIVAISMDRFGMPRRLFTTNRWVTGETWYPAASVIRMIDGFSIDIVRPNWLVSLWITSMVRLFRPEIVQLLQERDRAVARWNRQHPGAYVFEDRGLEITSIADIDVEARVRRLIGARES